MSFYGANNQGLPNPMPFHPVQASAGFEGPNLAQYPPAGFNGPPQYPQYFPPPMMAYPENQQIPQQYYHGNHKKGQGQSSRGYHRGQGHQNHHQYYHQSVVVPPCASGDPNIDEENGYIPGESFSHKAHYHSQGRHGYDKQNRSKYNKGRQYNNEQPPEFHSQKKQYNSDKSRQNYNTEPPPESYSQKKQYNGDNGRSGKSKVENSSLDPNAPVYNFLGDSSNSSNVSDGRTANRNKSSRNGSERYSNGDFRNGSGYSRGKGPKPGPHRYNFNMKQGNQEDIESQRDSLIEQLSNNSYECMVCCECVRREAAIWSCTNCYHVFHLSCLKKWARTSMATEDGGSSGWRCPACQKVNELFPSQYRCYCGKVRDPESSRYEVPHSCGEMCHKKRSAICTHPCNILCHPGPCPPCLATVTKHCDCGLTKQTVKCGQSTNIKCTSKCKKTLNCGMHQCKRVCHAAPCDPCNDEIDLECFCGKDKKTVLCGTSEAFSKSYSCNKICDRALECGNHSCTKTCHPGTCDSCELLPEKVTHCPCGKQRLEDIEGAEARTKCTDPIPTCQSICEKKLKCGPEDSRHTCDKQCHKGPCGPCAGETEVTCRCERFTKEMSCQAASQYTEDEPFTCDRRCNKKRQCGKHKCGQLCCVDKDHACDQICGRKLTCDLHRCEERCHRNNCPTCWHVSFEELRCYCGTEVMYPPIPCGTKPPECTKLCTREHMCGHETRHNCHTEERCPPCTELTKKWCSGRHEMRRNIPCHLVDISCGMPCGKELPCGIHKCQLVCHKGPCLTDESCTQPCPKPRADCGHPCSSPCHGDDPCPKVACTAETIIKCDCGNRTERTQCLMGGEERNSDFLKMDSTMLAMTMSNARDGQSLDISSMMKDASKKKQRKLDCTQECSILERNKRLALALEIKNPDVSGKLGSPAYNQFLRDYARQYTTFVASVEQELSNLVKTAEQSKQVKRSHAFKAMNMNQRKVVHELAEFYGCETQSYDEEPNKNVVATAYRGKCFHPSITLTQSVQREIHPKAPTPIPHNGKEQDIRSNVLASKKSTSVLGAWGKLRPTPTGQTAPPSKPAPWASTSGSASASAKSKEDFPGLGNPTVTGVKLKSMSVLRKDGNEKKTDKKKAGRSSPVIDYFDMS